MVQPKLDGIRCVCTIDSLGRVSLTTRNEKPINSVPHINNAIETLVDTCSINNTTFDGELYAKGMRFEQVCSIVKRNALHPQYMDMQYHIFDFIANLPQLQRNQMLQTSLSDYLSAPNDIPLQLVETRLCMTQDDICNAIADFVRQGYEGGIVRHIEALYEQKRSYTILKYKPTKSDTYTIIGTIEEQTINKEPKDSLGALILVNSSQAATTVENFRVGSGFTAEQRQQLWQRREQLIGKHVKIAYQELTVARMVPRFPVFIKIID